MISLTLDTLAHYCMADPQIDLAEKDPLGVPTGDAYSADPAVRARKFSFGEAGMQPFPDDSAPFEFVGRGERELDTLIAIAPEILKSRRHYRFKDLAAAEKRYADPKSVKPTHVPVVRANRMLTVVRKDAPERCHYHAIFLAKRNFERVLPLLEGRDDISAEWLKIDDVPPMTIQNARFCKGLMLPGDLRELAEPARKFAAYALPYLRPPGTLHESMLAITQALNADYRVEVESCKKRIDIDYLWRLCAVATARRHIPADASRPFDEWLPYPLLSTGGESVEHS
ncbi:hypothetical protein [Cupriavidus sp. CuC1]|uniref:hypothetical protein n=1 Tax=Cupriavidus sp. CuC1 TaxID=3373131 RepID=UPI0037CE42B0